MGRERCSEMIVGRQNVGAYVVAEHTDTKYENAIHLSWMQERKDEKGVGGCWER